MIAYFKDGVYVGISSGGALPSHDNSFGITDAEADKIMHGATIDEAGEIDENTEEYNAYLKIINLAAGGALQCRAVSATDVFGPSDDVIDVTSGTFTVSLPTAVGRVGRVCLLKNSGVGVATLDADTTETIDGGLTVTLNQYASTAVQSDGANWIIL